jgi:hypothetical protein
MKTLEEIRALIGPPPAATVPVVLLPVQVQTRYVRREGKTELLVRVYPDEVHLDSHQEELTPAEARWGRRYWELIWPIPNDTAAQQRAWEALAERFGIKRAAWVARRMTPGNLDARPAASPAFPDPGPARDDTRLDPALARALPDRWIVAGYRAGRRVLLEAGSPIPEPLPVGFGSDSDAGMGWMLQFDLAEEVGMGIRIALSPSPAVQRFDVLLVLGLKGGLPPDAGASQLEALLDGHHYTRGVAFVPPGTPTNNTADVPAGFTRADSGPGLRFGVEVRPPPLAAASDGANTARLLGIRRELFAAVDGASATEDVHARHMNTALWPATGGYYLEQMLGDGAGFTQQERDDARRFFIESVRGQGPLPTLRIGRQPYGLLPAIALDRLADPARFVQALRVLRAAFRSALPRAPRLRPGAQDDESLVEVLRMGPVSVGHRARLAFDRQFFAPGELVPGGAHPDLEPHDTQLRQRLAQLADEGTVRPGRLARVIPAVSSRRLGAALVQPDAEPGARLDPNYVGFLRTATFDDVLASRAPDTLLFRLLRHSVLVAQAGVGYRILARRGLVPDAPYREPVLIDIAGSFQPTSTLTLSRALDRDPALRAQIHAVKAAQEPEAALLDQLRASLKHLEGLAVDVLARHLAGSLDLFSYRLDAWVTALATRRLSELRRQRPRGALIGGYGWLEQVAPDPKPTVASPPPEVEERPLFEARERGGYIHAPSMSHASAAAVLRSGYLADTGDDDARPFAIDLRSRRVRAAQWLLDGVRAGQALAALLGHRFERRLHERALDRFLPGVRRVSLLTAAYEADDRVRAAQTPVAMKAARAALSRALATLRERFGWPQSAGLPEMERLAEGHVADGLELVERFRAGTLPFARISLSLATSVPTGPRRDLERELRDLDEIVDALADALTAESVFQLVRGNPARAAATVDAIADGEIQPPELEIAETPRTGTQLTHRLAVLLSGPAALPAAGAREARRAAEPALDEWLAQMLGDLRNVRFGAEFHDGEGTVLLTRADQRLSLLPCSHADALYLGDDLRGLLEHQVLRTAPAAVPSGAYVRLLGERTPSLPRTHLSLDEFLELLRAFREVVLAARGVDGRDLAPAAGEAAPAVDAKDMKARADAAAQAMRRAADAIAAAGTPDDLRERLVDLAFLGIPGAVPVAARGTDDATRERLAAQAGAVAHEAAARLERLAELEAGFDRPAADAELRVAHDQERLRMVYGASFRALPLVRPANAADLDTAFRRSTAVQGGDRLQALSWLLAAGRVRPGASRLVTALMYASAVGRAAALELRVAQLPSMAGERWVALPDPPGGAFPAGRLSLVAHLPRAFKPDLPLAGLAIDDWVEVVPSAEVTTGVAFHCESPGARPPQAVLLAVPPPASAQWDVETLEATLLETLDLARLRALDPLALGADPLLQRALPATYLGMNVADDTVSTDFLAAPV